MFDPLPFGHTFETLHRGTPVASLGFRAPWALRGFENENAPKSKAELIQGGHVDFLRLCRLALPHVCHRLCGESSRD